jgi:hypothetical protein
MFGDDPHGWQSTDSDWLNGNKNSFKEDVWSSTEFSIWLNFLLSDDRVWVG